MTRHLLIAGHGLLPNGAMDTGATGHISKGEHRYMKEDLFPAMQKYTKDSGDTFIFHSAYKVLNRGNIAELAKQHNADTVTEYHFDAFNESATGGHVIVHQRFVPDDLDLRLRDVIKDMIGLRFSHLGHQGISGRTDLGMVNTARNEGINFRLVELGFGTNKKEADILINQVDEYARKLVESYDGEAHESKPNEPPPEQTQPEPSKTVSQMADEVEAGTHGTGHTNRRNSLGVSQSVYNQVRNEVNRRAGVPTRREATNPTKSIAQMASEVEEGQHGTGHSNRRASLGISQSEYDKVRAEVNRRDGVKTSSNPSNSIGQMATEVINGEHGQGHDARRRSLGVSQSVYEQVRAEVNRRLGLSVRSVEKMAREVLNGDHGTGNETRRKSLGISQSKYNQVRKRVNELA